MKVKSCDFTPNASFPFSNLKVLWSRFKNLYICFYSFYAKSVYGQKYFTMPQNALHDTLGYEKTSISLQVFS